MRFDEDTDMDAVRFEISTLVRQLYPLLPEGVSYPGISRSSPEDEDRPERLMSFTLTGTDPNPVVGQWAEPGAFRKLRGYMMYMCTLLI